MSTVYTVPEIAKILRVNKNCVYKLIKTGHLSAIKIGTLKITSSSLERFLNTYDGKDLSDCDNVQPIVAKAN